MKTTNYEKRRLGSLLKQGKAWIDGKMAEPGPWPQGDHYWIIQDSTRHQTYHVLVSERPTWARYDIHKEGRVRR